MPDLTLLVDQYKIEGWTQIQVDLSMDQLANTFQLNLVSDISSGAPPIDIQEGSACTIKYGELLVLTGYIDTIEISYNATSTSFTASGRSKAGDLVDCTAIQPGKVTGGSWKNTQFLSIANDITSPFGIACYCDLGDPQEKFFKLAEGESCFDALTRLGRDYGLRVTSFEDGDVQFTRVGLDVLADVVIETGINVISGSLSRTTNERYSDYVFKGQLAPTDERYGKDVNLSHQVKDDGVGRYRPLLIESDEQVRNVKGQFTKEKNKSPLQLRAEWERNTRAGKSQTMTYEYTHPSDASLSWEMRPDELWRPNVVVTVRDLFLDIDDQFLVTGVSLIRDDAGTRTSLSLTFKEAYDPELPPKPKAKKGFSW